jgi:hypothetical protein
MILVFDNPTLEFTICNKIRASYAGENSVQDLSTIFETTDLALIVQLAISDATMDAIFQEKRFKSFWDAQWSQCGLNPTSRLNSELPIHEYAPLKTVSSFDLLKGFVVYQAYRDLVSNRVMTAGLYATAKEYLELSASFGSYFALNALCVNGLKLLKKNTASLDELHIIADQILSYAKTAAELYFTPGYLLLSNIYQELSLYDHILYPDATDLVMRKKYFYKEALIALCVAQQLESYSHDAVNNAYDGKSIAVATHGLVTTWFRPKAHLQQMSGTLLKTADMDDAFKQAKFLVQKIIKQYSLVQGGAQLSAIIDEPEAKYSSEARKRYS